MKLKRIFASILAIFMVLSTMSFPVFATELDYVAKIGETEYANFSEAMTAANAATEAVEVEIYGSVEFTNGMELNGSYNSITFIGKADGAKITINQSAGGDYLEAQKTVAFKDLTLAKANPAWSGNSGHMGNYFSVQGGTVTYTNCIFPNGACTSTGTATYNNCTFQNTTEYGLWVYDDAIVTVNGGTIDSTKGIKVYSEGEDSVTSTLTVEGATFTESVTAKPAVAIGYAESITLIGNTYKNTTGVLELDSGTDANCEGITFVAKDAEGNDISNTLTAVDRSNSNAACGVLVDGKIYTTVATAADDATSGSTVTLLFNSTETVELAEGVTLNTNGYTADNVTVAAPATATISSAQINMDDATEVFISAEISGLDKAPATESVVIKTYSDETLVATTTLANTGYFNLATLGVKICLTGDSSSWDTAWEEGMPRADYVPDKNVLYVDDVAVSEAAVPMISTGGEASVDWAEVPGVTVQEPTSAAAIGTTGYKTVAEAFAAAVSGDEVVINEAGTYTVPTGKNITITGAVEGVKFDMSKAVGVNASMTFNNVTFEYGNANYIGLQHAGAMVYNNCTINGQVFLYGTSEKFNNCTFNQTSYAAYNVWTYGAKAVEFNKCTFNSAGKSVLVYNEGACATHLTVVDTDFNASATGYRKAAIEIDTSLMPSGTTIVIDAETTAVGFSDETESGSSLWNDKMASRYKVNGGTTSVVIVAGVIVKDSVENAPQGKLNKAYISASYVGGVPAVFGEATGVVAKESFVVELYSGETLVGTATLVDNDKVLLNGKSKSITWHAALTDDGDSWWSTTWENGALNVNEIPDNAKLYVDGALVSTCDVELNINDLEKPITAAKVDDEGNVQSFFAGTGYLNGTDANAPVYNEALQNALNAGGNIVLLRDVTLTNKITVNNDATLDLNGKTITTSGIVGSRVIVLDDQCMTFVINANGGSINSADAQAYGIIDNESCADVTINGGTYDFDTNNGGLFKFRHNMGSFTLNDITVETNAQISGPSGGSLQKLDVNGGTFKAVNTYNAHNYFAFYVAGNAVATFDDVTIKNEYVGAIQNAGGDVTLNNCNISVTGTNSAPYLSCAVAVSGGGKMTINSGNYETAPKAASDANGQGTTHGSWTGIVMSSGGTMIVNGGTFSNGNYGDTTASNPRGLFSIGADADYGDNIASALQINGGTFNSIGALVDCETIWGSETDDANTYMPAMNVAITDGNFTGVAGATIGGCDPISTGNPVGVAVSGGTFSEAIADEYCAYGYECVDNGDGTYGMAEPKAFMKVEFEVQTGVWVSKGITVVNWDDVVTLAGETYTKGLKITLLEDATLPETLVIDGGKEVTIDLQNKKLTGSILAPDAVLTVKNGSIINNDKTVSAIEINAGTLVVENVNIDSERHAVRIDGSVDATINGGIYKVLVNNEVSAHTINVSGSAVVTIKDGTFYGPKGTPNGSAMGGSALQSRDTAVVTVEGGSFSGGVNSTIIGNAVSNVSVKGGTFDQDPSKYVAEGYVAEKNEDNTYGVKIATVKIGNVGYTSLAKAVAAVKSGDTVILLEAIELSESIKITSTVTVDLNGNKLTGPDVPATNSYYAFIVDGGDLTLKDSVGTGELWAKCYGVETKSGSFTMENGTITATNNSSLGSAIVNYGGNVTIKGGTLSGALDAVHTAGYFADAATSIEGGTLNGTVFIEDYADKDFTETVTKATSVELAAPDGYKWSILNDTTMSLVPVVGYTFELVADKEELYEKDDEVVITLNVNSTDAETFYSINGKLTFDNNKLEYTDGASTNGTIKVQQMYIGEDKGFAVGTYKTFTFKVLDDIAANETLTFTMNGMVVGTEDDAFTQVEALEAATETVELVAPYTVTLPEELTGETTVIHGNEYVVSVKVPEELHKNTTYTITYTCGENTGSKVVTADDSTFTVPAEDVVGPLNFEFTSKNKLEVEVKNNFVTGHTLILVKGDAKGYLFNDNGTDYAMYQVGNYKYGENNDKEARAWVVKGEMTKEQAFDLITIDEENDSVKIAEGHNVNAYAIPDGRINFLDATAAHASYQIRYDIPAMVRAYLASDVNADYQVTGTDVNAILTHADYVE